MQIKGIDVSEWQRDIDFNKVKASGVDFVIIRAGFGAGNVDSRFEANYQKAKAAGLHVGAYWYSYAKSVNRAKQEAEYCASVLSGKQFDYPIFFDLEEKSQIAKGAEFCTQIVKGFCSTLERRGYFVGLYAGVSVLNNSISTEVRNKYAIWVPQYYRYCQYKGTHGIWQYTSSGSVDGIKGNVDMNWCYVDYPSVIKANALNGYKLTTREQEDDDMVRYKTFDDIPAWAKPETKELMELGFNGTGNGNLDVSDDMLRSMIVSLRMCKALIASVPGVDEKELFQKFKDNLKLTVNVE